MNPPRVRLRLCEQREILSLIGWGGIVKHDHLERVAIAPKMLVVLFDSLADFA
ncbi:MAG TPA: hypothetical protein VIY49_21870 [Bryobacteraceae bacterium]